MFLSSFDQLKSHNAYCKATSTLYFATHTHTHTHTYTQSGCQNESSSSHFLTYNLTDCNGLK